MQSRAIRCLVLCAAVTWGCGEDDPETGQARPLIDPGTAPWQRVPAAEVADTCRLEPALLAEADRVLEELGGTGYAVVRYGRLCHEYVVGGEDTPAEIYSTTKTLGALVTGIAAYQTRDLPRTGAKTGPLSDLDRVDHWLDDFTFNPEARIAHVLGMVGHSPDLSLGVREFQYDVIGQVQINRLSDVVNTAIAQDAARLGANLEEFTQRHLFQPLGLEHSSWSDGAPDKVYGLSWSSTLRDMARVGLLMLNGGVWSGERIVGADWIYKMTHPSFEDANTAYGYLTWLSARTNWVPIFPPKLSEAVDTCLPAALWKDYPHDPSGAPDCQYGAVAGCEQRFDVGVWFAAGLNGQYIYGHPGLDMVVVIKDLNKGALDARGPRRAFWAALRKAIVARDPEYAGDEAGFCEAYGSNRYAPDLRR